MIALIIPTISLPAVSIFIVTEYAVIKVRFVMIDYITNPSKQKRF